MKKLLSFLCVAVLAAAIFCLVPITASASEVTGSCGDDVTYVYDTDTKVLTISGTGAMSNYTSSGTTRSPFYQNTTIRNNCTSVVIEDGVTVIGSWSLYYLTKVTSLTLPSTLTAINEGGCNNLNTLPSVDLPEGLVTIGDKAFQSCKKLTSLVIPGTVETIGASAFASVPLPTELVIPSSVKTIGQFAFQSWTALTSLTLNEGLETIGQEAFKSSGVTEVTIPASVTSMGYNPFNNCRSLTAYSVAEGSGSFAAYDGALYTYGYETLLYGPMGKQGALTVKEGCKTVGENAFNACSGITSLTLPEGLETIGSAAFQSTAITSAELPATVTSLGNYSFAYTGLTSIVLPNSLNSIGDSAFAGVPLTSIEIPASVTSIGSMIFNYCESLQTAVVNTAVVPGDNLFYGCSALTSVTLAEGTPAYGAGEFAYCSSLTEPPIIEGVTEIPNMLFTGCTALTGFEIPETVTRIGQSAFEGCTSLTGISIPAGVTVIDSSAFRCCSSITELILPEGLETIGMYAFAGDYKNSGCSFTTIVLPEGLTSLGGNAFGQCTSLTSITLPEKIVPIPSTLFAGCSSLAEVEIMGDLSQAPGQYCIMSGAFNNCTALERLILHCPAPDINTVNSYAFSGTYKNMEVHYPNIYPEWAQNKPLDVNGQKFIYVADLVATGIEMTGVEFRQRQTEDGKRDIRFIAQITPYEGCTVTYRYVVFEWGDEGDSHELPCPNTYAVNDDGTIVFTAVIKGIRPEFFGLEFTATAYIEVEGEWSGTLASNSLTASVDSLENQD